MLIRCNSCSGTYQENDNTRPAYYHVCPDEILDQPEVVNEKNELVKPMTRKPTPNPRNENLKPDPDKPGAFVMISEGSGVTKVE